MKKYKIKFVVEANYMTSLEDLKARIEDAIDDAAQWDGVASYEVRMVKASLTVLDE